MTDTARHRRSTRPTASSFVYLAIATAVAVLIALLPRTGDQPPPPTVAEFAPQAAKEIRKSQSDQSSNFGNGKGSCAAGQTCARTGHKTPPPPPILVPLVKQCYGDPPNLRQSPDPQSPPCIPYWKGANGGATAKGVTGNTITVALPLVSFEDKAEIQRLVNYFNANFQFYGRTIELKAFKPNGDLYSQPQPSQEQADAQKVDQELGAFASLSTGGRYGAENLYYDALAGRGIIGIAHRAGSKTDEQHLAQWHPYEWSVLPGIDTMQRDVAEFDCNILKDHPASYAGPGSTGSKRIFGLIYEQAKDGTAPDLSAFRAEMSACGIKPVVDLPFSSAGNDAGAAATNIMLKMVQANVTSIVCFCDNADLRGSLMQAATSEQYRPEWVVSTYIDADLDNSMSQAPPDQAAHVFGVSFRNKILPREQMPWYWAMKAADPNFDPPTADSYFLASRYSSLLLLASGIQTAGPHLTAQAFEAGLFRTHFPDPGAGAAPYYQARVGFDDHTHAFMKDATMFWYDGSRRGTLDPTSVGAECYVDAGKRYSVGRWPHAQPNFFGSVCSP